MKMRETGHGAGFSAVWLVLGASCGPLGQIGEGENGGSAETVISCTGFPEVGAGRTVALKAPQGGKFAMGPCGHVAFQNNTGDLAMLRPDFSAVDIVMEKWDASTVSASFAFSRDGTWFEYTGADGWHFRNLRDGLERVAPKAALGGFLAGSKAPLPWVQNADGDVILIEEDGPTVLGRSFDRPMARGASLMFRTEEGELLGYNAKTGTKTVFTGPASAQAPQKFVLSPAGESVFLVPAGGAANLFDTTTGKIIGPLPCVAGGGTCSTGGLPRFVRSFQPGHDLSGAAEIDDNIYALGAHGMRFVTTGMALAFLEDENALLVAQTQGGTTTPRLALASLDTGTVTYLPQPSTLWPYYRESQSVIATSPNGRWIAAVATSCENNPSGCPNFQAVLFDRAANPVVLAKMFNGGTGSVHAVTNTGATLISGKFDTSNNYVLRTRLLSPAGDVLFDGPSILYGGAVVRMANSRLVFVAPTEIVGSPVLGNSRELKVLAPDQKTLITLAGDVAYSTPLGVDAHGQRVVYRTNEGGLRIAALP